MACRLASITITRQHKASIPSTDITIVHISDTHDVSEYEIPAGDILVHSGDFSNRGDAAEIKRFNTWLRRLPHTYKIIVAGNHEYEFDRYRPEDIQAAVCDGVPNAWVLHETSIVVMGLRFWGASWNNSNRAYGLPRKQRAERWALIPRDIDIIITHNPPLGIFDLAHVGQGLPGPCEMCAGKSHPNFAHWGDDGLLREVQARNPPLHMYGHVHDQTGILKVGATTFSNAAMDLHQKVNVFSVSVVGACVDDAQPALAPAATPNPSASLLNSILDRSVTLIAANAALCRVGQAPVLDLDAFDTESNSLCLWKQSPKKPHNQRWRLQVHAPSGGIVIASRQTGQVVWRDQGRLSMRRIADDMPGNTACWRVVPAPEHDVDGRSAYRFLAVDEHLSLHASTGDHSVKLAPSEPSAPEPTDVWLVEA
jgi:hypothetical protein